MTNIQKVLVKSWIVKTSIFVLSLIALASHILMKVSPGTYPEKLQPFFGELFVAILLFQFLMTKKCLYSWGAIFLLFINNLINIFYILTPLEPKAYSDFLLFANCIISSLLAFIYLVLDSPENKEKKESIQPTLKIGGGVAIGKKPTHTKEIIGDKVVFIDLSIEGKFQFEVYNSNQSLLVSDTLNFTDYESVVNIITEQVNQI